VENIVNKVIIEERKRGWFGKVIKVTFYIFNAFMALWFVLTVMTKTDLPNCTGEFADACNAGQSVGVFASLVLLAVVWLIGGGILGLLLLATRGKKIIREVFENAQ